MTRKTYEAYITKAQETALPTALTTKYLIPGLISELGELYGVIAKGVRDELSDKDYFERMTKEYGDCLWMSAMLVKVTGSAHLLPKEMKFPAPLGPTMLASYALELEFPADPKTLQGRIAQMWNDLVTSCEDITGHHVEHVLELNLEKLASRKARGKINGNGDNR